MPRGVYKRGVYKLRETFEGIRQGIMEGKKIKTKEEIEAILDRMEMSRVMKQEVLERYARTNTYDDEENIEFYKNDLY